MAFPLGTPEEISARDKCWRANSPVIVRYNFDTSMAGFALFPIATFVPDQNYAIIMASISASIISPFGTEILATLGWAFNEGVALDYVTNNFDTLHGDVVAAVALSYMGGGAGTGQGGPGIACQTWDFSKFPIYLPQGKGITLAASSTGNTDIVYDAALYLIPTFA